MFLFVSPPPIISQVVKMQHHLVSSVYLYI